MDEQRALFKLLKLQFQDQFRFQEWKQGGKTGKGKKMVFMGVLFLFAGLALVSYSFATGYALGYMGLSQMIPVMAVTASGLLILFFTMIKTNGILFAYRDYDILMSLPVKTQTVIASRFLGMYFLNLLFSAAILIPMAAAWCFWEQPNILSLGAWLAGIVVGPLIPTTLAAVIGGVLIMIASRFRYANAVAILLSFGAVIAILVFSFSIGGAGNGTMSQMDPAVLADLGSRLSEQMIKYYPIAGLFTMAVSGNGFQLILFLALSLAWYFAFVKVLSLRYKAINTELTTRHTHRNYEIGKLRRKPPFIALYTKEWKRFYSSMPYILNTSIGAVMAVLFSGACFFMGSRLDAIIAIPELRDRIESVIPFAVAAVLSMTSTSSMSLSLEGKNFWLLISLPIEMKTIFKSKILVNLTLTLPAALICSFFLIAAFDPKGVWILWYILVPVIYSFFTAVFGMFINIHFPDFQWENETNVIKQSASSLLGMLGAPLLGIIPIGILFANPAKPEWIVLAVILAAAAATGILYQSIGKVKKIKNF